MSLVLPRTRETVSVGGTGDITPGGAVSGAQTFAASAPVGAPIAYWILDGTAWECGDGVWTGTVIKRSNFIASSTGAALNVSASAEIYSAPLPSDDFGWMPRVNIADTTGGLGYMNSLFTVGTSPNAATNNERVRVVPAYYKTPRGAPVNNLIINCTVAEASGSGAACRVALYEHDPATGRPTGPPIVESADISLESTGKKLAAFTTRTDLGNRYLWAGIMARNTTATGQYLGRERDLANPMGFSLGDKRLGGSADMSPIYTGWTAMPDLTGVGISAPNDSTGPAVDLVYI